MSSVPSSSILRGGARRVARASHTARTEPQTETHCTHSPRHSVSLHSTKNRVGLSGRGAALTRPDTAHHPPNQPKSLIVAGHHELLTRWAPHSFVHPPLRADTSARPGHHATPHWVWTTRGLPPALLWNARPSSAQPGSDAPQVMETGLQRFMEGAAAGRGGQRDPRASEAGSTSR